jgi:hypothetical protein
MAPARAAILACRAASSAMLESNGSQYHGYGYHLISNFRVACCWSLVFVVDGGTKESSIDLFKRAPTLGARTTTARGCRGK